jgi:hypothetical protein
MVVESSIHCKNVSNRVNRQSPFELGAVIRMKCLKSHANLTMDVHAGSIHSIASRGLTTPS